MTGYVSTHVISSINSSNVILQFFCYCQIEFLSEAQIGGYSFDTVVQVVSFVPHSDSALTVQVI